LCAAGTYQPSAGQSSCIDAPAGSFVATTGALSVSQCKAGTYQNEKGASSCRDAGAGYFVAKAGATSRVACPSAIGTTATSCPVATEGDVAATEVEELEPAPADSPEPLQAEGDAVNPLQCQPGTWSETGLSTAPGGCIEAEPGYAVLLAGATEQTECVPGTFTQQAGASSCRPAPEGTFVPSSGSSKAYVCDEAVGLGASTCPGYVSPAIITVWVITGVLVLGGAGAGFWWYRRKMAPGPLRAD
jgi:hypothetical protein